ncbi:MAG: DUF4373 domain-containing protein [Candidatus Altimarinota bacterium]
MAQEKNLNNWFKHDSNAKDDFKCMLIIEQLGCEGYGIFWILVETLRDQKDYRYPIRLIGALARKYNTTEAKMITVIKDYGLFEIDKDSFFFSHSLNRRMQAFDTIIEKRRIAGKKSAEARRKKAIEQKFNICSTHVERKDKIRKEKIRKDINSLQNFLNNKTANEISKISYSKLNNNSLCEETISFIKNSGEFSNISNYIKDENYHEWLINQILKYSGEANAS